MLESKVTLVWDTGKDCCNIKLQEDCVSVHHWDETLLVVGCGPLSSMLYYSSVLWTHCPCMARVICPWTPLTRGRTRAADLQHPPSLHHLCSLICHPTSRNQSQWYFLRFCDFYSIVHSIEFSVKMMQKIIKIGPLVLKLRQCKLANTKLCPFEKSPNKVFII